MASAMQSKWCPCLANHRQGGVRTAAAPLRSRAVSRAHTVRTSANLFDKGTGERDAADRVMASLPYLLPLLDVLPFGKFLFMQYPFVARAMAPLGPIAGLYNTVPFAPFIAFLAVYFGIVNNQNLSGFTRFNALQAVLLDVLLIIPQVLITSLFHNPGGDPLALQAFITVNNTIFLYVTINVAYGMGSSIVGQSARLPLVAEAADAQMRGRGGGGM